MKKSRLVVMLSASAISGCMSLLGTLADDPSVSKVFIGTRTDANLVANGCPNASPCLMPRPLAAVDLPLSLITDTLLLVYTIPTSSSHREP